MKIKVIDYGYKELSKLPERAHYNDSGADVFAMKTVTVPAHSVVKIGIGMGVELPDGLDICFHNKSGLSNKGIFVSNAPVDAGYTGEINAIIYNSTDEDYTFNRGDKLSQLVLRPVIYAEYVDELPANERGAGGFGSTGK